MTLQPEQILEDNLVKQLVNLKYRYISIADEADLLVNLKQQDFLIKMYREGYI